MASSSSRLRTKRDHLKEELQKLKKDTAAPAGAKDHKGDLMAAMQAMAQGDLAAPGLPEPAAAEPQVVQEAAHGRVESLAEGRGIVLADVVRISTTFLSAGEKRGQTSVVQRVHVNGTVDIAYPDSSTVYLVPVRYLETSCLPKGASKSEVEWFSSTMREILDQQEEGGEVQEAPASVSQQVHTSLQTSVTEATAAQAEVLRKSLDDNFAKSNLVPTWYRAFWSDAFALPAKTDVIKGFLFTHGYAGLNTRAPPRVMQLRRQLDEILAEAKARKEMPSSYEEQVNAAEEALDPDRLPTDLKRAALETYKSIIGRAYPSLTAWLNEQFPLHVREGNETYLFFYNSLRSVDFAVKNMTALEKFGYLHNNDAAEITLRHVASYVYERRTGDREGAKAMLALAPAGSRVDVAPQWLVAEANMYSISEYKRKERSK